VWIGRSAVETPDRVAEKGVQVACHDPWSDSIDAHAQRLACRLGGAPQVR